MDQDRKIRIMVSPFFLFASLAFGAYLNGYYSLLEKVEIKEIVALFGVAGVLVLPLGFVIAAVSRLVLPGVFRLFGIRKYLAHVPDAELKLICKQVGVIVPRSGSTDSFNAIVTFDHEILADGIHRNVMRRWTSFIISAHSAIALFAAHAVGYFIGIHQLRGWWFFTMFLIVLLIANAFFAWRETMGMLAFQAHRSQKRSVAPP